MSNRQYLPAPEDSASHANPDDDRDGSLRYPDPKTGRHYTPLLIANYLCLFIGSVSATLLSKYYFIHRGSSRWVSTWVQSAGFPLLALPICLPYLLGYTERSPFSGFTSRLLALSVFVGLCLGLVFNLILSIIIVKQKVTFSNLNCVDLLTLSSVLLALGSNHDRPEGLTRGKYFIGFFCTIGAGLLFALYLPVMQKIYRRVYCYAMVMEMQMVMEAAATALAMVGMASNGGFGEMRDEGERRFDRGPRLYAITLVFNVVTWQLCFMGTAGMIFLTSGLTGGICMTALMAINVISDHLHPAVLVGFLLLRLRAVLEDAAGEDGGGEEEERHHRR
ncbi:hypothetical protein SAY87_000519 [Trapa incisa]|uniref:Probable purine permease n=1 Tax=Trapa incisa TaxID=236973 RepID=A0AAN7GMC4_9MYRT|nr:hypothetical protein SAY87_000519 [Trapa incisa]